MGATANPYSASRFRAAGVSGGVVMRRRAAACARSLALSSARLRVPSSFSASSRMRSNCSTNTHVYRHVAVSVFYCWNTAWLLSSVLLYLPLGDPQSTLLKLVGTFRPHCLPVRLLHPLIRCRQLTVQPIYGSRASCLLQGHRLCRLVILNQQNLRQAPTAAVCDVCFCLLPSSSTH